MDTFDPLFARNSEPKGVLFAAAVMFLIGFADDIRELSAPAKVMGTVAVGVVLANPALVAGIKPGTAISIEFVERQPGEWVITALQPQAGHRH